MTSIPIQAVARAPRRRKDDESQHQRALIDWASWAVIPAGIPGVQPGAKVRDYLFAVPNGGWRSKAQAGILVAEGAKAGVWDLMLPVPVARAHGLWIEMKAGKNTLTTEQRDWRARMDAVGFKCVVCWDWEAARDHILEYLGAAAPRPSVLSTLALVKPDKRATARPKDHIVRDQAYLRLVAARPCAHCQFEGASQAAHENDCKAKGMKASDLRTMPLCHVGANDCHGRFDRYELFPSRAEHITTGRRWVIETATAIRDEGNWPEKHEYPF